MHLQVVFFVFFQRLLNLFCQLFALIQHGKLLIAQPDSILRFLPVHLISLLHAQYHLNEAISLTLLSLT